ncbi:MAG: ZIP family metal transporter [Wenzhouxiangellaceae bacterium]|nr:ZIP family metal transporter [Wenzhouxiangellaceae bacterium]MBS3745710.1 ZIP family metal transporter [Wenzhouxiangellaceae bacterium]MBS3823279.1 ZIP family metal transporter [Wenzhouxiangellaceae bacterium]
MSELGWIVAGGLLMSLIALSGALTLVMPGRLLERLLLPLVALAAGTLLGGAFFHMIPEASRELEPLTAGSWLLAGFALFLALEQSLHWHRSHSASVSDRRPFTYLILIGDALHNFVGGLAVASTFLISPTAGAMAWLAAAAHEVPQELGDFGVLVHGGWPRRTALFWNFVSALTFPAGAVCAWALSSNFEVAWLALFGAGNFIYIAASDLIPEIKAQNRWQSALLHFCAFALGLVLMGSLLAWFRG